MNTRSTHDSRFSPWCLTDTTVWTATLFLLVSALPARSQLTNVSSFAPANTPELCGIGVDPLTGHVWVYECFSATVQEYSEAGALLFSLGSKEGFN